MEYIYISYTYIKRENDSGAHAFPLKIKTFETSKKKESLYVHVSVHVLCANVNFMENHIFVASIKSKFDPQKIDFDYADFAFLLIVLLLN
jgi:hypothetical protein